MIKERLSYILKHYIWAQSIYKFTMSRVFRFIGLFIKTDNNLVLYQSLSGSERFDSPMAIYLKVISDERFKDLKHVWAFRSPKKSNLQGCEKVEIDTWRYFLIALKAKYWITNTNIERGLNFKKADTVYLNTWHGMPIKHIGNDVEGRKDYDSRNVNLFCYESDFSKDIYIRALKVNPGNLIPTGLPRNDELYNVSENDIIELKQKLHLPLDKKIILYAPTWRDSKDKGKSYRLESPVDFVKWERLLNDEYIVLVRAHHFTTKIFNLTFNSFIRDFTSYPSINDLFKISDILISDYSASIVDFSILERPIICFAYDYENYIKERGVYIDLEKEVPSGIFKTEDSVIAHIKNMDIQKESYLTKCFKEKFTSYGGNATNTCIKLLFANFN